MKIDKDSNVPLYLQLVNIIKGNISKQILKEGDKIPAERELTEKYTISRSTVRQALSELEKQGLICKIHGKGNFVSKKTINQDLSRFYSFSNEMVKQGKIPGNKILYLLSKNAGDQIANKLKINKNDKIFVLTRIRLADNEALMYETSYLPYKRFKNLSEEDIENKGLYNTLKDKFSATFSYAEETFYPCILNQEDSKFLNAVPGELGIIIERTTYEGNQIIEYTYSTVKGDKFKYKVTLNI